MNCGSKAALCPLGADNNSALMTATEDLFDAVMHTEVIENL